MTKIIHVKIHPSYKKKKGTYKYLYKIYKDKMIKTFSHHTKHYFPHHGQAALFTGYTVEQAGENRAGVLSAGRAPKDL